jgi:phage terminase large subunit-like protein
VAPTSSICRPARLAWRLLFLLCAPLAVLLAFAAPAAAGQPKLKPFTLEHFEAFCRKFIVLDNGHPLELEDFQRWILADFFAGTTEILVLLPKKNGKTTLLAALATYHLIYTPNAACYIAASAKDQAKIMYDQACGFVERKDPATGKLLPQSKALQRRVLLRKGTREIRSRRDSGFIWVLSGDKDTADGVIPTLALVDELHRHKDNGALYGVLADGLGPKNGQILTISTAGESMRSALGRIRSKAHKLPKITRKGVYTYARSSSTKGQPPAFVMHEWALGEKDDREDLRIVKQANPLSNNTLEKLRARKESPTMTPSRWARFACGLWVQGDDAAISGLDWSRCGNPKCRIPLGHDIYVGIDLGWRWDTTAFVPYEVTDVDERRGRFGVPTILTPPRDGSTLDANAVLEAALEFTKSWTVRGFVFDRNAEGEFLAQKLEDAGFEVIEHSQDPSPMADAGMGLAEAVGKHLVEHPQHDEFTAHVLAAKAQTTSGEKWRLVAPVKDRGARKKGHQEGDEVEVIDAAIAAAMVRRTAHAELEAEPEPPPIPIERFRIRRL